MLILLDIQGGRIVNRTTDTLGVDVELDLCTFLGAKQGVAQQAIGQAGLIIREIHGHGTSAGITGLGFTERRVLSAAA